MSIKSSMTRNDKPRSGIAHGGIGTGGIELRKDGIFRNFNIINNEPFGTGAKAPFKEDSNVFFTVRWQQQGKNPQMKILQIEEGYEVGNIFSQPHYYIFPWMTGIEQIDYSASFPFTTLTFKDSEMPFDIKVKVFSPFIPLDVKNSSIPAIIFDFEIIQKVDDECKILFMLTQRSLVGFSNQDKVFVNTFESKNGINTITTTVDRYDTTSSDFGTMSLSSNDSNTSYYMGWDHLHPYYERVLRAETLMNIDDTAGRNYLKNADGKPMGGDKQNNSIGINCTLKNRGSYASSFVYSWNFPNFYADTKPEEPKRFEGNYYSNFFNTSTEVAEYVYTNKNYLESKTEKFSKAFYDSSIPEFVIDQVNSHFNTFITSAWLTKDMNFGIQEGLTDAKNWGPLATVDVGMFGSIMTAALFPELDKKMHLTHANLQKADGEVSHGIDRNFALAGESETEHSRIDMPQQFAIQALRAYFWSDDRAYLENIWPNVKLALDYVLNDRDQNGDLLPDISGPLMCSYDNFPMYGNASFIVTQWLAALAFAIEAAKDLGDTAAVEKYTDCLVKGTKTAEDALWNGEYFRLYNDLNGPKGDCDEGCLSDQIIGQWAAKMVGTQDIFDKKKIDKALHYIFNKNYREGIGMINCSWPGDEFLHEVDMSCWNDQANTCWTGVELEVASLLIYEGLVEEGLTIIKNVDDRHRKFGIYFDHPEFGGHYYRPMSSYAIINAFLGFGKRFNSYTFAPVLSGMTCKMFFATESGYAHFSVDGAISQIILNSVEGDFKIKQANIKLPFIEKFADGISVKLGDKLIDANNYAFEIDAVAQKLVVKFNEQITVKENEQLTIFSEI